jgi:hypothetical protein
MLHAFVLMVCAGGLEAVLKTSAGIIIALMRSFVGSWRK